MKAKTITKNSGEPIVIRATVETLAVMAADAVAKEKIIEALALEGEIDMTPHTLLAIRKIYSSDIEKRKRAIYESLAVKCESVAEKALGVLDVALAHEEGDKLPCPRLSVVALNSVVKNMRLLREETTVNDGDYSSGLDAINALQKMIEIRKKAAIIG